MTEFLMPKLGADMTAGTLVAWRKNAGDPVKRGDIVAEVDTEKGVIDVEIFTSGVLEKLLVGVGQNVPVGTPLAIVRDAEALPASIDVTTNGSAQLGSPITAVPLESIKEIKAAEPIVASSNQPTQALHPTLSTMGPAARRRARQLGIDASTVIGASCGGAIMVLDNEASSRAPAHSPENVIGETMLGPSLPQLTGGDPVAKMRQAIAAAMARSKREIPHYYVSTTVDMAGVQQWLAEQNAQRAVTDRLLYGAVVLKAVALCLRKFPDLNAIWEGDHAVNSQEVHLGVAIALRKGGLVAPALHNTDRLSLDELMSQFRDLVNRARAGSLKSSELSDPTATVTSLGEQGVETVFGIIYPPQVALFGVGKIVERPWVVNGQMAPRPVMTVSLSGDHRATDGHVGAMALNEIDRLLQEPEKL